MQMPYLGCLSEFQSERKGEVDVVVDRVTFGFVTRVMDRVVIAAITSGINRDGVVSKH
jgi:hypothetical protein